MKNQNGSTGHTGGGHFIRTVRHIHVLDHGHFTDIVSGVYFILFYLLVIKYNDPAVKILPGWVRGNRQSFFFRPNQNHN